MNRDAWAQRTAGTEPLFLESGEDTERRTRVFGETVGEIERLDLHHQQEHEDCPTALVVEGLEGQIAEWARSHELLVQTRLTWRSDGPHAVANVSCN